MIHASTVCLDYQPLLEVLYNLRMGNTLKTRFAPSPTGLMHFGNLRTALFNFLYARRYEGVLMLRVEDTDAARSTDEYREAILADLQWLGLDIQEGPYYQSARQDIYDGYYQSLQEQDSAYPCFCTDDQLALSRKAQLASGKPPRYSGKCAHLTADEIEAKKAAGMLYTLRFRVPQDHTIVFQDEIKGKQSFLSDHIGDFIIRRQDKTSSFMFCNAVDDALMGVTHVLRGDDHLTNTPRQLMILEALGLPPPVYGHFPTILGPDGRPLSKRNGSRSIKELREEGYFPEAILNYLSRLGHYEKEPAFSDLTGLAGVFDLSNISHSPAHYDPIQLLYWQKQAMHDLPLERVWGDLESHVGQWVAPDDSKAFLELVRGNIVLPHEAVLFAKGFFAHEIEYSEEAEEVLLRTDKNFLKHALISIDSVKNEKIRLPFSEALKNIKDKTSVSGKRLFQPLRVILTGQLHGPELDKIVDIMSREQILLRFKQALDSQEKAQEQGSKYAQ